MQTILFRQALDSDASLLAEIRVEAMRPSLEALGRFDPTKAAQRFLASFVAAETQVILSQGRPVGFFVIRDRGDHLWFDQLQLVPDAQGLGLGRMVMRQTQEHAALARKPIKLMALKQSPANDFYLSLGFHMTHQEPFDIHYIWSAPQQ